MFGSAQPKYLEVRDAASNPVAVFDDSLRHLLRMREARHLFDGPRREVVRGVQDQPLLVAGAGVTTGEEGRPVVAVP